MVSKEFNLSEKRKELFKKYKLLDGCKKMILEQDKEFIRLLKEEINFELETHIRYGKSTTETKMRFSDILKKIDKLAGDKLI